MGPVAPGTAPAQGRPPADDSVGPGHLRRLTRLEYDNTVRDLLGDDSRPAAGFASDTDSDGAGFVRGGAISAVDVDQLRDAAERIAAGAMKRLPSLVPCNPVPTAAAAQEACARDFVARFARRAYRRPVGPEEIAALTAFYARARAELGHAFPDAIRVVIQAVLQSPSFVYRWELGNAPPVREGQLVRYNDHEIASRLSYALWASMPDDLLFAAADAGQLRSVGEVEKQARRMLADPKAKEMLADFGAQWLAVTALGTITKDTQAYPLFSPAVAASMEAERREFLHAVLGPKGDGKLETLLTAPFSFVDGNLAKIYGGVTATSAGLTRVNLDPARRSGLLTQPAFLTAHAAPGGSHPIARGKQLLVRVLCTDLPAPPEEVPPLPPAKPGLTTRERFDVHGQNECARGCHAMMDPLGFAFEHYDGIGAYRATDAGKPVDATGTITLDGAKRSFRDAVELTKLLAASKEVRACAARQLVRYVLKRHEAPGDAASLAFVDDAFAGSGYDLREALVAAAKSRSFFYRQPAAGEVLP
jgi:hypothetical protein